MLTDIHGAMLHYDKIKEQASEVDVIALSGDITHFGRRNEAEEIIETIRESNPNILAIPGNCDYSDVSRYLAEEGISLHCRFRDILGIRFIGVGGSLPCPGKTPFEFTEEELGEYINLTYEDNLAKKPFIMLMHQPPYETLNDNVNGHHVGSKLIRSFIENTQPLACLCGHIHEGVGVDKIGMTYIINPGPFREGRYAFINISDTFDVNTKIFQPD